MDPDLEEPLFADMLKEEILESEEGQMRLAAGKDEGWPVKKEAVDTPVIKEEEDFGEMWGNGGYTTQEEPRSVKRGNPDFGENTRSHKTRRIAFDGGATEDHEEATEEPFPVVVGLPSHRPLLRQKTVFPSHVSFNAHVLLSNEVIAKKEVEEEEGQNDTEERRNCLVDGCLKNFFSFADLVDHMKIHPKPVICGFCQRSFPSAYDLRRHYIMHTGERPYSCNFCDKRFTQSSSLTRHIRTHTGERPYGCDLCVHKTAQLCALKTHRLAHLRNEGRYSCSFCDKSFADSASLMRHARSHGAGSYECGICGFKTSIFPIWNNHCLTHPKEKR